MTDEAPILQPWLITKESHERPAKGTVIRCENGHDFATIIAETGGGETHDWPIVEMVDGKRLDFAPYPIRCQCGAIAIDGEIWYAV